VSLKRQYPNAVNLYQLKPVFEKDPFGEEANGYLKEFIEKILEKLRIRSKWIEMVRQAEARSKEIGDKEFATLGDILKCFDIKLSPDAEKREQEIRSFNDILIELSSPLLGYLNRVEDGFEFVKSLEIQD